MSLYPFGSVPGPAGPAGPSLVRQKSECYFSGLSLVIPTTPTNLINLIKNLAHSGSLAPFFNTTTNKLNVFNQNTTVTFKVNVIGTWSGASTNRSMTVDFPQTNGNSLTKTRDAQVTTDILSSRRSSVSTRTGIWQPAVVTSPSYRTARHLLPQQFFS